jgi:1,4-dihydroxy-2-naphthoate octaprenyltransferase
MAASLTQKTALATWWLAIRPRTLPAAAAPVLVGSALAFYDNAFQFFPALAALLGALLLQIGANLANDVFDFQKGADTAERLGPPRVTALGLLTPNQVLLGMSVSFALAALIGLYLVYVGGVAILVIGILAVLSAVLYTGGPLPLGYLGLGELFVFLFFGLAAVCGTYYVQTGTLTPSVWLSALPMGLLAAAILVVNNLRDIDTDRAAGKQTLAVRLGAARTKTEYRLLLAAAFGIPLVMILFNLDLVWLVLTYASVPLAVRLHGIVQNEHGRALNAALAGTAQLEFVYALLFALGLVFARVL